MRSLAIVLTPLATFLLGNSAAEASSIIITEAIGDVVASGDAIVAHQSRASSDTLSATSTADAGMVTLTASAAYSLNTGSGVFSGQLQTQECCISLFPTSADVEIDFTADTPFSYNFSTTGPYISTTNFGLQNTNTFVGFSGTSQGLPTPYSTSGSLPAGTYDFFYLFSLDYNLAITIPPSPETFSLTLSGAPVIDRSTLPLPASGWLLLSALGGLGLFGMREKFGRLRFSGRLPDCCERGSQRA